MFEAIVIGSGVGGLTAASLLAESGRKVLLLEQHVVFGGYLQRFYLHKTGFDSGCHYVGALGEGQTFDRYLRALGVRDAVVARPLDPDGFDVLHYDDWRLAVPAGHEAFAERLAERFPRERRGIEGFLREVREEVARFPLYALREDLPPGGALEGGSERTLAQVLDAHVADPALREVLGAHTLLHFVAPRECPFSLHALVLDSYLRGASTIEGGGQALANAMVKRLRAMGATCRRRSRVTAIEVEGGRVRGVRLADGQRAEAPLVIAAVDPKVAAALLPPDAVRPAWRNRVERMRAGLGGVSAYLRVEGDLSRFAGANHFMLGRGGVANLHEERWVADPALPAPVFLTVPSAREARRAGPHAVELISGMRMAHWARWADTRTAERGPEYEAAKAALGRRLVDAVRPLLPELDGGLLSVDVATPLTYRDYTLNSEGSIYGLHHSIDQAGLRGLSWRTRVDGLYLAGHSVLFPGLLGAMISAFYACGEVLGMDALHRRLLSA